jgi:hypothetical protein
MKFHLTLHVCAAAVLAVFSSAPVSAADIAVPPGGDLQGALMNAQPGDTILLTPGATYAGNFTLPDKGSSTSFITIRTAGDVGLPAAGARISPAQAPLLAKIRSPNGAAALRTLPRAHHWRVLLLEFPANVNGVGDILVLGDGSGAQNALSQIPHDLIVDRVYIHGDPAAGQKRGIALNSASTTITGSYISDIKSVSQDSQAICGWNGPGPFLITNNYLEAAGENIMFGGADPSVANLVPSDITITGNHVAKQPAWRTQGWLVKNLFELKNARRATVARNTFEYNWAGGQAGVAVLFTVRNQDGGCSWCQVDHVTFEQNVVRHSSSGISILGYDNNHPSLQTHAITIRNNLFADIDHQNWGGGGYFLQLSGGARDVTIDHNTIIQDHGSAIVGADGPPIPGFRFTNNVARHNAFGFVGTGHAVGNDSIGAFFPGAQIVRNAIAGGDASRYPGDNSFPTAAQFEAQFVSYRDGDYRLAAASAWRRAGTDGRDLGASFSSTATFTMGDFDGDGKADATVFRPSDGMWHTRQSSNGATAGVQWGSGSDVPVPGDYDGDRVIDIAVFRLSTGVWHIRYSATGTTAGVQWGNGGDRPVPADYDGDGKTDIAIFRPSDGTWYLRYSGTGTTAGVAWGNIQDVPAPADYDGDGRTDITVFRPSTGIWYTRYSATATTGGVQWGSGSDKPVPGDYDGDGKADIAVFRLSNGVWYLRYSSTGSTAGIPWGNGADVPVPGDYDGDGKTDIAVFRPSNGTWYLQYSSTGTTAGVQWGNGSDVPILKRP